MREIKKIRAISETHLENLEIKLLSPARLALSLLHTHYIEDAAQYVLN